MCIKVAKNSCCDVDEPRVYDTEWSKSQREKQILNIGTDEPICRAGIEAIQSRDLWTQRGKREGGMNWESNMDKYTTMCKINS